MTEQDFNMLRGIIKAYSDKRDQVHDEVTQLREDVKDRKVNPWAADERILQLYTTLTSCEERKSFILEEKKIHNNPKFEKYFRSAAMEFFLGNKIKPEDL